MKKPWKNRLLVRFFFSYLLFNILLFLFFYFYSGSALKNFYISLISEKMLGEAKVASRLLPFGIEGEALDRICRDLGRDLGARVTVIALDGKVLGDSDEPAVMMENHGGRPEVLEALSKGQGRSVRHSATVGYDMLYQALLYREAGKQRIIRISVPFDAVEKAIASLRSAVLLGVLAVLASGLALAMLISSYLERRIQRMVRFSQAVAQGSFPQRPLSTQGEDELGVLEKNLNEMNRGIQDKIKGIVAEKEKVDSILRGMTEGVLVVDNQGRVILLNHNAQKMFNLPPAQSLQGASLLEVSRHPEMKRLLEEVLVCDCSTECFTKEISMGAGKWFRVSAVSLRGADGPALGYILVFHDVTELKRLETVRADFVANVSHELRTPLTAIRGYAETLLRNPPADPKDGEHFLTIIQRHSERLGRLIDDLLTISDLESGKIRLEKEKLQAADLIGKVLEIFHDQAARKNVALAQSVDADLPLIVGDSDRLQQLLINLIDNALKYTDKGTITVSARQSPIPNSQSLIPNSRLIEISVADTGCGISEKDLPRLTERFYRVDKARSRELGGTGLGLAIVKHIVQAHNGLLKIESQVAKGSTVRVFLPSAETGKEMLGPYGEETST